MNRRSAVVLFGLLAACSDVADAQSTPDPVPVLERAALPRTTDLRGDPLPPGAIMRFGSTKSQEAQKGLFGMAISPDGKSLVTLGVADMRIWDAATGELKYKIGMDRHLSPRGTLSPVAFGADSRYAYVPDVSGITRLDCATGEVEYPRAGFGESWTAIQFSRDGQRMALTGQSGVATYAGIAGPKVKSFPQVLRRTEIPREFEPLGELGVLAPDGKSIAHNADLRADEVRFCEPETGSEIGRMKFPADLALLAYSPNSRHFAVSLMDKSLHVYESASRKEIAAWKLPITHNFPAANAVVFAPDSRMIAVGMVDGWIRLYDSSDGREVKAFTDFKQAINAIVFSPDGATIFYADSHGRVTRAPLEDRNPLTLIGDPIAFGATVSPDGRWVAGTSEHYRTNIVEARTGRIVLTIPGATRAPDYAFSYDGRYLARLIDSDIEVFEWSTGRVVCRCRPSFAWVRPENRLTWPSARMEPYWRQI